MVREHAQGHVDVLERALCFRPCSSYLMTMWIRLHTITKLYFQINNKKGTEGKEN